LCLIHNIVTLNELILSYEDEKINTLDLAFVLATHGYNVVPNSYKVIVEFNESNIIYLEPNGKEVGIARIL